MDYEIHGTCVRQRWRKNTLREVYFGEDGTVIKRYWVSPGARLYPKPWLREHEALLQLDGLGFPRSHGLHERPFKRGREIILIRDYVEGRVIDHVSISDATQIGSLLARMHSAGVIMDDAALDNFVRSEDGKIQCIDFGCAKVLNWCPVCLSYACGEELAKLERKVIRGNESCWKAFVDSYFKTRNVNIVLRGAIWLGYGVSRLTRVLRKDVFVLKGRKRRYEDRYGIARCRTKKFEKGELMVHPQLDCRGALEAYISKHGFLDVSETTRLSTHNKRYRVYSFHLGPAERDVILKVSWANPAYGWARRFNIRIVQLFRDYAKSAFLGALALDRVGIRTIQPLAYWRYARSIFNVESYLLYERYPAEGSVLDLVRDVERHPTPLNRRKLDAMIDQLADMVRCMHDHGLRHDDTAVGNFLIEEADLSSAESEPERRYQVVMIDTDHVAPSHLRGGLLKSFFDLRDLRRLNLSEDDRRRFMKRYLGDDFSEGWWRVHMFWRRWGKHPVRMLFQIMTGRGALRKDD